jgi:hypothetical protein
MYNCTFLPDKVAMQSGQNLRKTRPFIEDKMLFTPNLDTAAILENVQRKWMLTRLLMKNVI